MGDRMVIGFQTEPSEPIVYLYSHWGGEARNEILVNALSKARNRWEDSGYGTRIVMSHIIGNDWSGELGYGIYVNDYPEPDYPDIYVVEWSNQVVSTRSAKNPESMFALSSVSFEDFVKCAKLSV